MGYTHYWTLPSPKQWQQAFPQLVSDALLIAQSLPNIPLCLTYGEETEPPLFSVDHGIRLNGRDWSHEDFVLTRTREASFKFCKTARKPYDVVVTAILLRASMIAGLEVRSDGDWDEWMGAREVVAKLWPGEEVECPWDLKVPTE
ncbi:hypothetical protein QBC39DRAFT_373978 [Podospora conica]|nr:hypothetical protein QBC39DRAFT_373978 [Schizothecium conicum]